MKERIIMKYNRKINEPVSTRKPLRVVSKNSSNSPKAFDNRNNSAAKKRKINGIRANDKEKLTHLLREDSQIH